MQTKGLNKRAMELSVNFMVTVILALVIFGFGVKFVYDIVDKSNSLSGETMDEIDKQIAAISCNSNEQICIDKDHLNMKKGDSTILTLKLINEEDIVNDEFDIQLTTTKYIDKNGDSYTSWTGDPIIITPSQRTETVKINKERFFGIHLEVSKEDAQPGTYIINLIVTNAVGPFGPTQKIYINI